MKTTLPRPCEIKKDSFETPDDEDSDRSQVEFEQLSKSDVFDAFLQQIEQAFSSVQPVI